MIWFWGVWDRFKTGLFESPNTGPWVRYGYALMHFIGLELWNLPIGELVYSKSSAGQTISDSFLVSSICPQGAHVDLLKVTLLVEEKPAHTRPTGNHLKQRSFSSATNITLPTGHTGRGGSYYKVTSKVLVFCYGIRRKKKKKKLVLYVPMKNLYRFIILFLKINPII